MNFECHMLCTKCTWVRVLLRHSVVVACPKRIVINHTQLFTIRFRTSVPKSKSGSYISPFVLELPFSNRKAEAIFPYSFWNFRSQIEKRKLICHNLFWKKSKNKRGSPSVNRARLLVWASIYINYIYIIV